MSSNIPYYGLPLLPALPCPEMRGPTPWSNWVIRGRVLAGAYPATVEDFETERILTTLLELGVNTFVCLQAEFALYTPETAWRSGQGLRPYIKDAQRLLIRARESNSIRIKQDKLDFLHLPIIDGSVTSDSALSRLADDCNMRILRGERLYIHCWGGHGRTGTLVATMLGRLYSLSCSNSLRYTQAFHDSRKYPQGVRSPQTQVQVAQVRRLLPDPPSVRGVFYPQPTIALTDEIIRSGTAPPSPLSPKIPSPTVAEIAVFESKTQLPINQQRKEAIRAKYPPADQLGSPRPLSAQSLAATFSRTHISQPMQPAIPQGASPSRRDLATETPLPRPQSSSTAETARRQAGYMQQFMQQRKMHSLADADAGIPSKLGDRLGSGRVFNLTASSREVPMRGGAAYVDDDDEEEVEGEGYRDGISAPLRPNQVTVTVPPSKLEADVSRPGSGMGSVMGYMSSRMR